MNVTDTALRLTHPMKGCHPSPAAAGGGSAFAPTGQKTMPREHRYFVYILSSKSHRIYTGVTNNIARRVAQHKAGEIKGFTQQYKINRLVYFEVFHYIGNAIHREKEIKHWIRSRRVALIERENPTWDDLAEDWGKPIELLKPIAAPPKADPPRQGREG
jgi:putative endonuclease